MDLIRKDSILGNKKVIVGDKYTDLVLETLGKVYVKTGNKSVVLDNLIKSLMDSDSNSEIIFTNSTNEMQTMEYPGDGRFIYNKLTNTLYISLDSRYIQLIEASLEGSSGYVRKQGDTMSGQLEINTIGAPLIVASSQLVKNFNAEYLNNYSSDDFAKKRLDEMIYGNWSFDGQCYANNNWIFKENVRFYRDIVTSGNLSSPQFAGGFGGYGWMLDSNTNTLTIDNLVVRKAMQVYEMVINQISATNGSLWVSNSTKVEKVYRPYLITKEELDAINTGTRDEINAKLNSVFWNNNYFLVTDLNLTINQDTNNLGTSVEENIGTVTESKSLSSANNINTIPKEFVNFKYIIWIGDLNKVLDDENFPGVSAFYDENYLFNVNTNLDLKAYYLSKEIQVTEWNEDNTPKVSNYLSTFNKGQELFIKPRDSQEIVGLKPYYKYFALSKDQINSALTQHVSNGVKQVPVPTIYIIDSDSDMNPTLKSGDIVRCQKFEDNNIKYYDAIVTSQFKSKSYILQKAASVFDTYTEISYSDTGEVESRTEVDNSTLYNKTGESYNPETGEYENNYLTTEKVADVAAEDDIIQMGNIYNTQRQNAIYITSTDDQGPYIDIMSGLNRPDYSVIYDQPVYKQIKVFVKQKGDIFVQGEPYNYYYQKENPQAINFNQKPAYISGNTKKYPLVYVTVDTDLNVTGTYINDGETNNIPSDTSQGYFITNYPTQYSIKEDKVTGTKITKVRLGNLDGIYNEVFGNKQPYGFGLYGENVFLTGEFYLNNGKSVVDFSKEQIELAVSNIKIGGRNLVPNSKKEETSTAYGFAYATVELKAGKEYVFSANGRCSQQALNEGHYLSSYVYNQDWSFSLSVNIKTTQDSTSYKVFTVPSDGTYGIASYLYPSGGTRNGTVTLNWYQVEEGNKPTDWSPNPNDTEQAIESLSARLTVTEGSISAQATKITTIENDLGTVKTTISTAGWITTDQGNTLWATKAENQAAANKAQTALENAATGIANAAAANTLANTANNAAKNAQSTADAAKNQATTNSTLIQQNSNNISVLSGRFNTDGSLKNTAGLVTTSEFSGLFATEFEGKDVVTSAEISAFITEDDLNTAISNIRLTADRITFEGYTIINNNFKVDNQGNMVANNATIQGTIKNPWKECPYQKLYNGPEYAVYGYDCSNIYTNDNIIIKMTLSGELSLPWGNNANGRTMNIYITKGLTNFASLTIEVPSGQTLYVNDTFGSRKYDGGQTAKVYSNTMYTYYGFENYCILVAQSNIIESNTSKTDVLYTTNSVELSEYNNVAIASGNVTVSLPKNPVNGSMFTVRKRNAKETLILSGNGHQIVNSHCDLESEITYGTDSIHVGCTVVYFGDYWYEIGNIKG